MDTIDFRDEPKVMVWKKTLDNAGCIVGTLKPLALLNKPGGELLFALCDASVTDPQGNALPRYIFIRGHACIVITLVKNSSSGEERFLMIRQRRIGNGEVNLEFPAGMLDRQVDAVRDVAVRELREETGLVVSRDDIRELHSGPLYSSPGASDEGIYYFGCTVSLSDTDFKALDGRVAGSSSDGERITVTLCTRESAESETTSLQARLGMYLFSEYLKKIRRVY
jgi:8-oxo-dGTP pyrophosphatase MutT (NUDIX family)